MKINYLPLKEILDLEKEIGIDLIVTERPAHYNLSKFYVSFEYSEIKDGGVLIGSAGNGNSIDEALADYCNITSNKDMVFKAYSSNRRNIKFPKLQHTKLLGK